MIEILLFSFPGDESTVGHHSGIRQVHERLLQILQLKYYTWSTHQDMTFISLIDYASFNPTDRPFSILFAVRAAMMAAPTPDPSSAWLMVMG